MRPTRSCLVLVFIVCLPPPPPTYTGTDKTVTGSSGARFQTDVLHSRMSLDPTPAGLKPSISAILSLASRVSIVLTMNPATTLLTSYTTAGPTVCWTRREATVCFCPRFQTELRLHTTRFDLLAIRWWQLWGKRRTTMAGR
jgi:hypothetical protein